MLEPSACSQIISPKLFVRWMDVLCEEAILRQEKSYCPNITCNVPILNECGEDPKKSKCPRCKRWFCFQCSSVWHAGFRCEERNQYRDENDIAFGQLVESNNWKRCPGCKHFVERTVGCPNIKCRCGISFCYVCGECSCSCNNTPTAPEWPESVCGKICLYLVTFTVVLLFTLWMDSGDDDPLSAALQKMVLTWVE